MPNKEPTPFHTDVVEFHIDAGTLRAFMQWVVTSGDVDRPRFTTNPDIISGRLRCIIDEDGESDAY